MNKAQLIHLVIDANSECERCEYSQAGGPYDRLSVAMNQASLATRIDAAELMYLHAPALRGTRAFDNCFEQGDGREVAKVLTIRSRENPQLRAAIARDFGGEFPRLWEREAA